MLHRLFKKNTGHFDLVGGKNFNRQAGGVGWRDRKNGRAWNASIIPES